jgi:hypothetical protein
MTTRQKLICSLVVTVLGGTAAADPNVRPPRPDYRADGSVAVGTKVFPTRAAYYASTEFQSVGRRCATHEPPPSAFAAPTDCSLDQTVINPEYDDNRVFVVQVVFHVIRRSNGVGAISQALIDSQIDILNEDFQAIAGTPGADGSNARIEFVLARFKPDGTPTTGVEVVTNDDWFTDSGGFNNPMKLALHWDTTRYLNIYTNDAAGFLGYATFPSESAGDAEDGIVLLWDSVGRNSPGGPPYNQGRTATHEVGHYLGLLHTFEGGCGSSSQPYTTGDLIADTQREDDPQFGCPMTQSSCGGGLNPVENYMDYSDDTCMTKFTDEQANRIRCSMVNFRTINTKPTASFTFTTDLLDASFTSTSTDAESPAGQLHYSWDFGDGGTSTLQSPTHSYAAAGTYVVTLEVVDPGSGASETMESVVVTSAPPPPDARPGEPDADPLAPDADPNNPADGEGGGCCQTQGGDTSFVLCGVPVALVLLRRRRRRL